MMQMGQAKTGMLTLNQSLFNLYKKGHITKEQALQESLDVEALLNLFKKAGV